MNRYQNVINQTTADKSSVITSYVGVKYPELPYLESDLYVYTTVGDRLDTLAQQFYGSPEYYWVISSANPELGLNSLYVREGSQVRIPTNLNNIILGFKKLNNQ